MKTSAIWILTMALLSAGMVLAGDDSPPICFTDDRGTTICV